MIDGSCNLDFTYDQSGNLSGWVMPAPGETSILDPSNHILGGMDDCNYKKFLDFAAIDTSLIDLSGNNTQDNYLQFFQQPRQIKLT